jgi:hypothetical protein
MAGGFAAFWKILRRPLAVRDVDAAWRAWHQVKPGPRELGELAERLRLLAACRGAKDSPARVQAAFYSVLGAARLGGGVVNGDSAALVQEACETAFRATVQQLQPAAIRALLQRVARDGELRATGLAPLYAIALRQAPPRDRARARAAGEGGGAGGDAAAHAEAAEVAGLLSSFGPMAADYWLPLGLMLSSARRERRAQLLDMARLLALRHEEGKQWAGRLPADLTPEERTSVLLVVSGTPGVPVAVALALQDRIGSGDPQLVLRACATQGDQAAALRVFSADFRAAEKRLRGGGAMPALLVWERNHLLHLYELVLEAMVLPAARAREDKPGLWKRSGSAAQARLFQTRERLLQVEAMYDKDWRVPLLLELQAQARSPPSRQAGQTQQQQQQQETGQQQQQDQPQQQPPPLDTGKPPMTAVILRQFMRAYVSIAPVGSEHVGVLVTAAYSDPSALFWRDASAGEVVAVMRALRASPRTLVEQLPAVGAWMQRWCKPSTLQMEGVALSVLSTFASATFHHGSLNPVKEEDFAFAELVFRHAVRRLRAAGSAPAPQQPPQPVAHRKLEATEEMNKLHSLFLQILLGTGQRERAERHIRDEMKPNGVEVGTWAFNSTMLYWVRRGDSRRAEQAFADLQTAGVEPDAVSIDLLTRALLGQRVARGASSGPSSGPASGAGSAAAAAASSRAEQSAQHKAQLAASVSSATANLVAHVHNYKSLRPKAATLQMVLEASRVTGQEDEAERIHKLARFKSIVMPSAGAGQGGAELELPPPPPLSPV